LNETFCKGMKKKDFSVQEKNQIFVSHE
jgi:hypothetical protein